MRGRGSFIREVLREFNIHRARSLKMVILVMRESEFIGSHLVDKLLEKGFNVRIFDLVKPHRDDVE